MGNNSLPSFLPPKPSSQQVKHLRPILNDRVRLSVFDGSGSIHSMIEAPLAVSCGEDGVISEGQSKFIVKKDKIIGKGENTCGISASS